MRAKTRAGSVLAALAAALLVGCGGGGGGPTGAQYSPPSGGGGSTSTSTDITVSGYSFSPASTTVPKGTTVNWSWNSCTSDGYGGQMCVDHSLVWDDGSSGGVAATSSGSYSRTFPVAGSYGYHCAIHGTATSGMHGTIAVQ